MRERIVITTHTHTHTHTNANTHTHTHNKHTHTQRERKRIDKTEKRKERGAIIPESRGNSQEEMKVKEIWNRLSQLETPVADGQLRD